MESSLSRYICGMRSILGPVCFLLIFSIQSAAQSKDCWVFVSSKTAEELISSKFQSQIVGYSAWFNAYAIEGLPSNTSDVLYGIEMDSLVCYDDDEIYFPAITALDRQDSVDVDSLANSESNYVQISILQGELFAKQGLTGKGVTIGVLDAGYLGLKEDSTLQHIFKENRVKATKDFVRGDENVYRASNHGTHVMSCLAGLDKFNQFGLATGANFVLARAEQNYSAFLIREARWIQSLEWAVSQGAQIVTSSLIFSDQLFKRSQMNGQSMLSKAAEKAWEKGVLVLNSAGNSGDGYWEIIGAPGDAEHVLTVGACNYSGYKSEFSSIGPTSDYRMKPNVVALGDVFVSANNAVEMVSGTSFACPMVAGFAACVLEKYPNKRPADLWSEIQFSADLYPYYDYAHGYGIPQASYFLNPELAMADTHQVEIRFDRLSENLLEIKVLDSEFPGITVSDSAVVDTLQVPLSEDIISPPDTMNMDVMDYAFEENPHLLFLHIENDKGQLEEYWVVRPDGENGGMYDVYDYKGQTMRVFYRKRIFTFKIE